MRNLSPTSKTFLTIGLSIFTYMMQAQEKNTTLQQDPKFEQILTEKRKLNTTNTNNNSYWIQIYSGKSEEAKKALNDFKTEFSNIDATIVFNTPNYKVLVGNFENRIEGEKNLIDIKKRFGNVFLIKPQGI
ncbi:SPOR domain-containing protein [Flavobacterium agrisoli]|uniref:SPOR domain-containing protein n=1 Tax=Flavobacterium agrisoli TaxID=2793066 RepID=A0A934PNM9_9FLAO|nr:SPOR domain-containing protein [Flavobacterium agrisoli]MBK0370525.1 SPOR domain-containing protein [Flavobacterium agrisoli]